MTRLKGVIIPAATPLTAAQTLDGEAFERLLSFLLTSGVQAIFANGSMGAFALLPDAVQYASIEKAAAYVAGRAPVLAGASESGTARVLEKVRAMKGMGADYFVVLPPYYYLMGQGELLRFYREVAEAASRPVILYENPRLTKNTLGVETVAALAAHPNIHGIKVSTSDVFYWQELLRAPIDRERFSLICGAGKMTSLALQLGFDGITEGLHNIIPEAAAALYQAQKDGRTADADCLQQKINRCFGIFEADGGWRGLELAFQYMGIATKAAPHPFDIAMTPEKRQQVLKVLQAEGIARPYPSLLA